ncbi:MAG TPA: PH domain-containing protein [Glaciihabitans sp.]|jgi:uncharacterized membrane protein YdbT with pleckstrin-like domain|nr:PH domain-containing protein [Glaciihabitans sp.]
MSDETGPTSPEAERLVAHLRPNARALFWPAIVLIVIAAACGYFTGTFADVWQNWAVVGVALALIFLLCLLPFLAWLSVRYTITTRRIVLRRGLFVRTRQELLHSRGYDVTVRKNALQALFHSGNVEINTGLDHPVVLRDVPRADLVQSVLHDLMDSNQNLVSTRRQQEASRPSDETTKFGTR